MDQLNPIEGAGSRTFSFESAWMWPIVIIAAIFVGYLCFDAWRSYLHNKWFKKRKEEALKNQAKTDPASAAGARQQKALAEREHGQSQ